MNFEYLERHWQSDSHNEQALQQLLHSLKRCQLEAPLQALKRSPRWRRLTQLIDNFYQKPLTEDDGEPLSAIQQKEAELGHPLPEALKEWYRLVGRRFASRNFGCPSLSDLQSKTPPLCGEERERLGLSREFKVFKISRGQYSRPSVWLNSDDLTLPDPPLKILRELAYREPRFFSALAPLSEFLIGHCFKETFESSECRVGPFGAMKEVLSREDKRAQSHHYLRHYTRCYNDRIKDLFAGSLYYSDGETILKSSNGAVSAIHTDKYAAFKLTQRLAFNEFKECYLQFQWNDPNLLRQFRYIFSNSHSMTIWKQLSNESQQIDNPSLNYDDEYSEGCFLKIATTCPIDDYDVVKCQWLLKAPHLLDGLQVAWKPYLSDCWTPLWPRDLEEFVPIEE